MLLLKFVFPPYTPVTLWLPCKRLDVVNVATPPAKELVPNKVIPSKKSTVPEAVPTDADTVAVNVTVCPNRLGLGAVAKVVVVLAT